MRRNWVCDADMSLPWRGALRYGREMGQFLGVDIVFYLVGNEGLVWDDVHCSCMAVRPCLLFIHLYAG